MPTCVFCGFTGKLTGEHVFGDWLSRIGLNLEPVADGAGPLNLIGRELGIRPPFRQTVKDVCGDCNNGWMSQLEVVAQRVLTPVILGKPGQIATTDAAAIAMWTQKTALTAMPVAPQQERDAGYRLPASEYRELWTLRDAMQPLAASQFWLGRYEGVRSWSVQVTPLVVTAEGLPESDRPQDYAMTIVLGQLVLHGVRFTTPSLQVDVITRQDLPQLWPTAGPVTWPSDTPVSDDAFLGFAGGKDRPSPRALMVLIAGTTQPTGTALQSRPQWRDRSLVSHRSWRQCDTNAVRAAYLESTALAETLPKTCAEGFGLCHSWCRPIGSPLDQHRRTSTPVERLPMLRSGGPNVSA